MKKQLDLHVTI